MESNQAQNWFIYDNVLFNIKIARTNENWSTCAVFLFQMFCLAGTHIVSCVSLQYTMKIFSIFLAHLLETGVIM